MDLRKYKLSPADLAEAKASLFYQPFRISEEIQSGVAYDWIYNKGVFQVAEEIAHRLGNIFLRDKDGKRPVHGGAEKFQNDPHWRDCLLFYEYFHGDNGAGLGASHQTGWTGVVATLMHFFASVSPEALLAGGRAATFGSMARQPGQPAAETGTAPSDLQRQSVEPLGSAPASPA